MTKLIEATRADGTRQLIAPSRLREYARVSLANRKRGGRRLFGRLLANMMFCNGFVKLVEINYNSDGQTRTLIMAKA